MVNIDRFGGREGGGDQSRRCRSKGHLCAEEKWPVVGVCLHPEFTYTDRLRFNLLAVFRMSSLDLVPWPVC